MKSLSSNPVSPARISTLDGLRGVAIAMVLWHHLAEGFLPLARESWLGWLRFGTNLSWAGVDLFFVLSGFFIGGILIDQRESPRLARVFYVRRALRIFPLYYIFLIVAFGLAWAGLPGAYHQFPFWVYGFFLTNIALSFTLTWDWMPVSILWSLAVEEQFYFAAPWVVKAVSPGRLPWLAAGLIFLAWGARIALLSWFPDGHFAVQVLTPFRMDQLAAGVLVAWVVRAEAAKSFLILLKAQWKLWFACAAAAVALLTVERPPRGGAEFCLYGYSILTVFFALLIIIVVEVRPAIFTRALSLSALTHLGRHSYFIYLFHMLIGQAVIFALGGGNFVLNSFRSMAIVLLAITTTWAAAVLSWKLFEGPLIALGHRRSYQ